MKVADQLSGVIPGIHLSDVPVSDIGARFKVGQKLSCRVLKIAKKNLILTAKRTLVNSEYAIIADPRQAHEGTVAHGYICSVKDDGITLGFYSGITGYVPASHLGGNSLKDPKKSYMIGQVKISSEICRFLQFCEGCFVCSCSTR